jgi:NADP-dependent 3-hydroxy acid dehydrogenase YdfG
MAQKVVLITGATSGIGRATAILLSSIPEEYKLILTGRRAERLEAIHDEIKNSTGAECRILAFDVRDLSAIDSALSSLSNNWQNVDILINNAGLAKGMDEIQEGNIDHWETMIDTNVKGLLYMSRRITPGMVQRRSGQVINVCSLAGKEVYPKGNVYNASKFAVDALTRAMRLDLYKYNIRVGSISPGAVEETEFSMVRYDNDAEKANIYQNYTPLTAKDVAEAILFMISRPPHVNIQDILLMSTQQGNSTLIDRSGRL